MNALPPEILAFGLLAETTLDAAMRLLFTGAQYFFAVAAALVVLLLAGWALRHGLGKEPAAEAQEPEATRSARPAPGVPAPPWPLHRARRQPARI